jgi:hypothetical protein
MVLGILAAAAVGSAIGFLYSHFFINFCRKNYCNKIVARIQQEGSRAQKLHIFCNRVFGGSVRYILFAVICFFCLKFSNKVSVIVGSIFFIIIFWLIIIRYVREYRENSHL